MSAFDLKSSCEVLERTPGTLRALLAGLSEPWLRANEGPESFNPFDVLGHLIDAEESNWLPRARLIRAGNESAQFEPFDRFRHRTRNLGRPLEDLLDEFAIWRKRNLAELRSWELSDAELEKTALHPEFGQVTLRQLLATWVVHDLGHIAQIVRVMAKQQRLEVGPWAAFLPILSDRERPS